MKDTLLQVIKNKKLFTNNEPIIVALSGGVDSMVLFHILQQLSNNLVIAHVNHNKRKESIDEYTYISRMAKQFNVPFEGYTVQKTKGSNFHHDSRLQRYDFFKAIAQKYNSTKIAVAHHLDDQVETVLMRIVRGSSFAGYSGIKEIRYDRNVQIIRPLMDFKKKEIIEYSAKFDIPFFEDKSNKEDVYTRNRFRNNIIPMLKKENPNLDSKIIQLAEYIDSADEILEEYKDKFVKEYTMYNNASLEAFNNLNKAVKFKVITYLVNHATNNTVEVSYEQYKNIIELCLNSTPNQKISLNDKYIFVKEYEVIYVEEIKQPEPINMKINNVGEYFVDDNKSYVISHTKIKRNYSNYFELCYNELVFPLYLRQRQNGDKMKLKIGTKKIKDILIDQKVPLLLRDHLVMLSNDNTVLWIPGIKKSYQEREAQKRLYIYEVE